MKMIQIDDFSSGLYLGVDSTKAPLGSCRVAKNMVISDRSGIAKRPGALLLGTLSNAVTGTKGLSVYKKTDGETQLLIKGFGTKLEYYHPDYADWTTLEDGFTSGQEWGFATHFNGETNEDYHYMGNAAEAYRRWSGAYTLLNGALAGGETTVTVDSVLDSTLHYSGTASASSTTTIDISPGTWVNDLWNTYYVKITSGAQANKISLISDTTSTRITFATITGLSGTPTFEIYTAKFAASGTLVIEDEELAYSAIPTDTTFTTSAVVSAHADNSPVTILPTEYPGAPKGNVLATYLTRMLIGNVRSGIGTDGTNAQGSQSTGSFYVSSLKDATDFTFTYSGRQAGEGDVVPVVYGGGNIKDIVGQENKFYVFKEDYIEGDTYSQDANDAIDRDPLKQGVGTAGRTIKGKDDIYFVTPRNEITSIGRVENVDVLPQTANIGYVIKRYLDTAGFGSGRGIEFKDRIYFPHKETTADANNNRILVFNKITRSFEGLWYLSAFDFADYQNELYYGDPITPNVFKMLVGLNDVQGSDVFGITSEWQSNWMNFTPSDFDVNNVSAYAVEGYIKGETTITFELYKDFASSPSVSFDFSGSESEFITADNFNNYLGANALGISPESALGDSDENGFRHFKFVVYFPHLYGNHFAVGVKNDDKDQAFDISRIGLGVESDKLREALSIKTI